MAAFDKSIKDAPDVDELFTKAGLTITFGEGVENHAGMEIIGKTASEGFKQSELEAIHSELEGRGVETRLIDLGAYLPSELGTYKASVLVIPNGVSLFCDAKKLWDEIAGIPHDKKAFMYGRVVNKIARHNLCFYDFSQTPDFENKKGTVVDFKDTPLLSRVREGLPDILGEKSRKLGAETNLYYDVKTCGINAHNDRERKIVVGVRLGQNFAMAFRWIHQNQYVGPRIDVELHHGDIYIMDEKACGNDGAKRSIPTLRHAAGCEKYIKSLDDKKPKKARASKVTTKKI